MAQSPENERAQDRLPESLWSRPAGYRDVLRIAIPLVLSTGSWSVQHFVDRMFLNWYDTDAMSGSFMAGMTFFTVICFFLGTVTYGNTFVAQYHGAERHHRVGPSVWQSIYYAAFAGALLPFLSLLAGPLFALIGHDAKVQDLEARYFGVVTLGTFFFLYNNAASNYYTGLGRNWPVACVNAWITVINLCLDYAMIFGHFGFSEMGIEGAAWATNIANAAGSVTYTILLFTDQDREKHALWEGRRFDRALFGRLMKYGLPNGVQFMLDMLAFSLFNVFVGRMGARELAATTIGFQINTLAFLPMIGFSIATTTMVGRWLGRDRPDVATRATWSAFHLTFGYMTAIALLYLAMPAVFILPFAARVDPAEFEDVRRMATTILYFVAAYSVFDTMNLILAAALKGAGDTRFVMYFSVAMGWLVMVLPTWLVCERGNGGIFWAWTFLSVWVITLGFGFLVRFLRGKWKSMRVIEPMVPMAPVASSLPESPATDVDM